MRALLLGIFLLPTLLAANLFPHFNPKTVQTFKGKISSVQTLEYVTRPTPHKQILLRTLYGEVTVDLGPEGYLNSQGIALYTGEEIEVVGSLIQVNGTRFVIASSVIINGVTYKLRENNSSPI